MCRRVLLLLPTTSYKATDLLEAAGRLDAEVVVGTDRRQALEQVAPGHTLALDFRRASESVAAIVEEHRRAPFRAVLGADDETTVLASMAGAALGLRHNPESSARSTRDKHETRRLFAAAGLRGPTFRRIALDEAPREVARRVGYPCVLKPLMLSASRGVIRADDPGEFVEAHRRIAAILRRRDVRKKYGESRHLLVEDYLPGTEVALEGLLDRGRLQVLALFDKPDPLCGPFFEESLFVTPSRLPEAVQAAIHFEVAAGCRALGLVHGPVHAELRVHAGRPWLLEVAARTIGGLCSRTLRFGTGVSLEELVLRHALGLETAGLSRRREAAAVMMIPIPGAGRLLEVQGLDDARSVPLVEEVTLTRHRGAKLVPLPEGHEYLGFVFARGETPAAVEKAVRDAHARLQFIIDPGDE